jgi:myo-inositol-1(or 4)-monophosphatase
MFTPTSLQINEMADFARFLAVESAAAILPLFRNTLKVDAKAGPDWDPVTEADRAAERVMRFHIENRFPDHGIVGEEFGTKQGASGYKWILDPIDGTRAFVVGMPTWATLIGLYYDEKPLLGVMNQPFVGDMFVGVPAGSTLERLGERQVLRVRKNRSLAQAQLGTTTPHRYPESGLDQGFSGLRNAIQLARYGGDAYFFCLLAAGHLDLALDPGLQIYDIAALIPIIQGAGGVVTEWTGGNPAHGGNIIAAASGELLDQACTILRT